MLERNFDPAKALARVLGDTLMLSVRIDDVYPLAETDEQKTLHKALERSHTALIVALNDYAKSLEGGE